MAFKLKLKRGTAAPTSTALDIAEPGYDTAAKKLYIGNGSGVAASGVSMDGHVHAAGDITSGVLDIARLPTITAAYGGTGITSYAAGDMLYASGATAISKLGIGSTGQILTVSAGGLPVWANAGQAASVANSLVIKVNTGTTEGTSLYTFNGSAAKTVDFINGGGISLTTPSANTISISHSDTSSISNLVANGRTYVTGLTFDTYGHITSLTTGTETVVDTNTTYSISALDGTAGKKIIRLTGSDAGIDDVTLVQGSNITLSRMGDEITIASAHPAISAATSANNSGNTFIQDITLDSYGHITGLVSAAVAETQLSKVDSGVGNVVSSITVSGHQITINKDIVALTQESDTLATVAARGASTNTDLSLGNVTMSGYLRGPSTFTIDPSTHGDDTGTVIIAGNLTVQGTTTTINSNTISVGDNIIVLNGDVTGTPTENAGIEIERGTLTNTSILWNETSDRWTFVNPDATTVTVPSVTGTIALTSDLHTRSHAITSTSDHTANAWKIFYSNGSGNIIELGLGAAGTYLQSNGATSAPTFVAASTTFIGLTDTPNDYTSAAGKLVSVNSSATGIEFISELDCGTYAV